MDEIEQLQYRSFPQKRRELIAGLVKEFGHDFFTENELPGFWRNEQGSIELSGRNGIAIPVRNIDGTIHGLKIRVDKPSKGSAKYLLLSSNPAADKKSGEVKYPFGASAKIAVHYPLSRPKKIKTLRITEGEVKADLASSLTEVYTVSLPGVNSWRMALEAITTLRPERVLIAMDSDKGRAAAPAGYGRGGEEDAEGLNLGDGGADQFIVGKAVGSLYLSIKEEMTTLGLKEVAIEDWPEEAGKGIDDVLVNGNEDQIRVLSGDDADAFAQAMLASEMPQGWVYIVGVKRFYNIETLVELDKEQYADRFCHIEKGNPAMNALRNPAMKKVDLPIYLPGREMFLETGDALARRKVFNTWRPGDLEPREGDVTPFLKHCEYILPNPEERDVFLDWLAFNIQFPGKKILWAILLQGLPGTGKSYFGTLMRWILGERNVSCPTNEIIHEIYTAWQKSCSLVVIEEIMARGRLELMNKFKPMITQDTTMVREMQKPAFEQPNVFNLLMFTNHEDAIIVDATDRRYCVLFSPAKPIEHEYYADLWDWTKEHRAEIFHFFKSRDLSGFKHLDHAPMTAGKRVLISESMPPLQAWIEDCISGEIWPFMGDLVSVNHLMSCLPTAIRYVTPQSLGRALKAAGARQIGQIRMKAGNNAKVWSLRRHEVWESAEEKTVAAEYERWSMLAEPGGNPLADARPV